jgi:hypothetical protein
MSMIVEGASVGGGDTGRVFADGVLGVAGGSASGGAVPGLGGAQSSSKMLPAWTGNPASDAKTEMLTRDTMPGRRFQGGVLMFGSPAKGKRPQRARGGDFANKTATQQAIAPSS